MHMVHFDARSAHQRHGAAERTLRCFALRLHHQVCLSFYDILFCSFSSLLVFKGIAELRQHTAANQVTTASKKTVGEARKQLSRLHGAHFVLQFLLEVS
jgi:hypothetical protein